MIGAIKRIVRARALRAWWVAARIAQGDSSAVEDQ
jgi:hypothetical protein